MVRRQKGARLASREVLGEGMGGQQMEEGLESNRTFLNSLSFYTLLFLPKQV
jgi:hypothetical protein